MGSAPSPLAYTETTSNIKYQLPAWLEASNRWRVAQQDKYLKQQQAMAEGLRSGNKAATYKFFGLPKDASPEQYAAAVARFKGEAPPTATQKAAQGGIMQVRGFAGGGSLTAEEVTFTQKMAKLMEGGGTPTTAQQDRLNAIEKRTDKNVSPFTDVGTKTPGNKAVVKASESMQKSYTTNTVNPMASESEKYKQPVGFNIGKDAAGNPIVNYTDPTMKAANQAVLNALGTTPAQFQQGSDMMTGAYNALSGLANFKAPTASAAQASASPTQVAQVGNVAHISAPELQYFQANRGDIRDVEAAKAEAYGYDPTMAETSNYTASQMNAPEGIEALGYDAAQMQAAQMNRADVRDINAQLADVERYNASLMNAPQDIQAQAYEAARAGTNQMNMPSSWTEAGTAEKYMNPYMQNVVDIQKREANRDYQKQLNELNKQAVGAKAYGGSRLAIERAEAARNQATKLADIEAEGLNQAYQQGIGQFATEQGQTLQAGQANLTAAQQSELANQQALNTQRQAYVTQALEAAKNNYGGQLTAAQQNQIAQNAASQFNAQAQNTAYNNYVAQQLAAQQANQQMDFGVGQLNTQNQQAANASNQAAINAQRSQYVTQALQAAQNNYAGQLTAEQQNQIARNAEAQFNANANMQTSQYNAASANTAAQYYTTARNQAEKDYYAQMFAAAQLNQGMDAQTVMSNLQAQLGVQNTQVGAIMQAATSNQQSDLSRAITQGQLAQSAYSNTAANQANVSIANMQGANTVALGNTSNAVNAANIALGAGTAMGSTGQGLGALGTQYGNYLNQTGDLGIKAGTAQFGVADYLANIKANNVAGATTPPAPGPSSSTPGNTNSNVLSGNQLV